MGSVCANEQRVFNKLDEYRHPDNITSKFIHARGRHSRFGNIQKIRTRKNDVYKLIMATSDAKMQTVSIECRIMQSTAQFELYDGTKFELQDRMLSPLIDLFNPNEQQIYHPIKSQTRMSLTLKAYPFTNYSDNALKRGIYEIWLYNQLRSGSPLVDHFIMSRAKACTLVMIFRNYEVSLLEIVRYRQLAEYHWSEAELVTLWKLLISNYKQMKNLSICHRDIRLGKIFYTSDNRSHPFQFANLETARKVSRAEASDLLTVVGVSLFAESPMRENIEKQNEVASYDPWQYDIDCLVRVLLSLLNLDPLQSKSLACRNEKLSPIVEKLKNESENLDQIQRDLEAILRSLTYDKNELFSVDKIISEHLSKSELRRKNSEKIQSAYFNALLQLHKKDAFNKFLLQRMEENEGINKRYDNIALLHKVGEYYANVGIQKNEYFQEEYRLLLDLAQECREEEFYRDQDEYLNQARQLQQFISKDNLELSIRYQNELVYKFIAEDKLDTANQRLSTLLDLSLRYSNIHINTQTQILLTKARLQIADKRFQAAEVTIEKLGQVVGSNNFDTVYDAKRYLGELEHIRGYLQIQVMNNQREEIKKKRIAVAETSLSSALTIFTNLPESNSNTVKIVNTYIARGDLGALKEDYPQARKNLQSADILLIQMEKQVTVSDNLKQKVLQRMKTIFQRSNKLNQPAYRTTLDRLSKLHRQSEQSNASRHQRSKQLRSQQRIRTKQQRKMANELAIEQLLQQDEA